MGDVEVIMEFRQKHWEQWEEFVKGNDDYCQNCCNDLEFCECHTLKLDEDQIKLVLACINQCKEYGSEEDNLYGSITEQTKIKL
jgi:hypothetical protein